MTGRHSALSPAAPVNHGRKGEQALVDELTRGLLFGAFLDDLSRPTPNQLWLERAAAQLREERDPDGSKRRNRSAIIARISARDGSDCWFCGKALGQDISIEHLTPLALQGSWADDNLALAHKCCNKAAGHLTRFEKEKLRDEMRAKTPSGLEGRGE